MLYCNFRVFPQQMPLFSYVLPQVEAERMGITTRRGFLRFLHTFFIRFASVFPDLGFSHTAYVYPTVEAITGRNG